MLAAFSCNGSNWWEGRGDHHHSLNEKNQGHTSVFSSEQTSSTFRRLLTSIRTTPAALVTFGS